MIFSETDSRYKDPFGAVRTGEAVHFRITPETQFEQAMLTVYQDGQKRPSLFPMRKITDGFGITHTFDIPGLYYYCFTLSGEASIMKGADGQPVLAPAGHPFQITVYDADYRQPQGYAGGLMYQIFPDRFAIGEEVIKGPYHDRVFHGDLMDVPEFRPNEKGQVLNNDYFGGNLKGIEQKLDYLRELGVTCIYLNPIGEAHSNHRYDTANYMRVDPTLGSEADFSSLCRRAHDDGIKIILDGVYSHTGADSVYFNKNARYASLGAYQSELSDYFTWYTFEEYPNKYKSWWGFDTLPELNEEDATLQEFVCGEHGVLDYWLSLGANGFRLDVADELPDAFIAKIRRAVKRHGDDKMLIGEVWEDASNKISYGVRRAYLQGRELDSVMNYPFRTAILNFVRTANYAAFMAAVAEIVKNYPKPMLDIMMNILSTHDTERAMTALVVGDELVGKDREWQFGRTLSRDEYLRGVEMLKLAMVLQFTLPGIPCIYYGDEIGMQGMKDPFNRGFMRWDDIDHNLLQFTKELAALRRRYPAFADGQFIPSYSGQGVVSYLRKNAAETVAVALNRSEKTQQVYLSAKRSVEIAPWSFVIERVE